MTSPRALLLIAAALAGPVPHIAPAADLAADAAPTAIEQAAIDAARGRVLPPDRFEPESWRVEPAAPVAVETLEVREVVGPDPNGTVRIALKTVAVDGRTGEARVTVRGRVRGPALVARRALTGGTAIDPSAVEVAEADLTRLTQPPLRSPHQTAGLAPRHAIGAGRTLTADLLHSLPVVHRGDALDLRFERGRLLVRTIGIVRQDGAAGDLVTAENTATGASVVARVQPDGSLLVLRAGEAGRTRR